MREIVRNIIYMARRFKLPSCFNMIGLIVAFATFYLLLTQIIYQVSYNHHIKDSERLYRMESVKKRLPYYAGVFCYPLLSYFSYHGFFILCYMLAGFFIVWVVKKHFPKTIFASLCILSAGYMAWEYRLFSAMLFDDTVTIRTSMDHGSLSLWESLKTAAAEFFDASFHSQDDHVYLVLWVCLLGLLVINIRHLR